MVEVGSIDVVSLNTYLVRPRFWWRCTFESVPNRQFDGSRYTILVAHQLEGHLVCYADDRGTST